MITAFRPRDAHPPTADGRTLSEREFDHVSWEFERVRSLMIEKTAREFGFAPVRRRQPRDDRPSGDPSRVRCEETERVEVSVEIDFDNSLDPDVCDLENRFTIFLQELEDLDIAHMIFEVDRDDERSFLGNLSLAFLTAHQRGSAERAA